MYRWFMAGLSLVLIITAAIVAYNLIIEQLMKRAAVKTERDFVTGIMKGAEPILLKHGSSDKAALLIHGFIGSPTDFGKLPSLLQKQGYDVYAPLLPGHGTDPKDFSKTTADELESFVMNEYKALKKKYREVVLVGFSMGGALSVLTASREPVDKLVLIAPYFRISHQWYYIFPTEFYQRTFKQLIPYTYRPIAFKQINNHSAIPYIVDYDYVSLRGAEAAIELGNRAMGRVKAMRQPTLILHSRGDRATDYHESKKAAVHLKEVAECEFVTLEKSNHILLWDYDAEAVQMTILNFIKNGKGGAAH